jgi:D-alanyl-D-alanine carboxypeptidase
MPTDGTYPTASITKTFTSAAVLQLIEEGQISLDNTLDQWLPDYPDSSNITVRQMLEMTSGIPDLNADPSFFDLVSADINRVWTLDEVLAENAKLEPYGEPDEEFHYSSANYWALGSIVEKVTGQPFAEVLDERFFTPHVAPTL